MNGGCLITRISLRWSVFTSEPLYMNELKKIIHEVTSIQWFLMIKGLCRKHKLLYFSYWIFHAFNKIIQRSYIFKINLIQHISYYSIFLTINENLLHTEVQNKWLDILVIKHKLAHQKQTSFHQNWDYLFEKKYRRLNSTKMFLKRRKNALHLAKGLVPLE